MWDIGKQWRPRPDAAECGIWSRSPLFAYRIFHQNLNKNENYHPAILKMEMDWSNWYTVGNSIWHKWVEQSLQANSPRNLNIFWWTSCLIIGFKRKQSLLAPDSSLPLGVTIRRGREPFCSSSHISAIDSLYPPPQSSTDSPENTEFLCIQTH